MTIIEKQSNIAIRIALRKLLRRLGSLHLPHKEALKVHSLIRLMIEEYDQK